MTICNNFVHFGLLVIGLVLLIYVNLSVRLRAITHMQSINKQLTATIVMFLVSIGILVFLWTLEVTNCPAFLL